MVVSGVRVCGAKVGLRRNFGSRVFFVRLRLVESFPHTEDASARQLQLATRGVGASRVRSSRGQLPRRVWSAWCCVVFDSVCFFLCCVIRKLDNPISTPNLEVQ